jgi:hypothetical protein
MSILDNIILQPHHASYSEALGEALVTGRFWMRQEWVDADVVLRNLEKDGNPRMGFLECARIVKHSNVGWSSRWDWVSDWPQEIDMSLYGRPMSAPPRAKLKWSVIAVRGAYGGWE